MSAINTMWILVATVLVFFMQAGFAMLETGFTRAKNAGNIVMKNMLDFCIGAPVYWFLGFGIMYGSLSSVFGGLDFFISNDYSEILPPGVPIYAFAAFQIVFCAAAATIVSGAMAERTKFSAYCIYSIIISSVVYPVSGHWIWGGGFLQAMGFHDFAGSTAVHVVGGVTALIGASFLGPRIGKYGKNKESRAIPGHNLTLSALGIFILWFGWFGFTGGCALGMEGDKAELVSRIFMNLILSAALSTVTAMLFGWVRYRKPDISMTINAALAGLVSITAGCDVVTCQGAALIGVITGFIVILALEFIDKVLKIDDPAGAIGVHGVCGAFGTIAVGFLAADEGFFYTGNAELLGIQALGVLVVAIWVSAVMIPSFYLLKRTIGLRVSVKDEIAGLDSSEHGLRGTFADFGQVSDFVSVYPGYTEEQDAGVNEAIPVIRKTAADEDLRDMPIMKVEILTRQSKFEALKEEMNRIGVTGMTVTQVLGCGVQNGATEFYRGIPLEVQLRPKIRVEMVVVKVPVEKIIATARKVLYTGHIGDGKIFIYDVKDAIKIRTGEAGYDALQGMDE